MRNEATAAAGGFYRWCGLALIVCLAMSGGAASAAVAGNWPAWRGDGSGVSSEKNVPLSWSATGNVAWTAQLDDEGNSSPIVWGDKVFLTASADKGAKRIVICISAANGKELWRYAYDVANVEKTYPKSGYASPTPVTDGKRVFAFFAGIGLVALDVDGKPLWQKPLGPFKNVYNMSSSPVLYKDVVILNCDCEVAADSFIIAVNQSDGNERWKTPRAGGLHYSTPLLVPVGEGTQVVVNAQTVVSYDADTGKELWSCAGLTPAVVPSVVAAGGLVYATCGRNGPTVAIDPNGRGDITETPFVKFQMLTGGPYVPSPLAEPLLMLGGDDGAIRFVNAQGNTVLSYRAKGHFTASPVLAAGRIYWSTEAGLTYVLDASKLTDSAPAVKVLAANDLGEKILASPAIAGGKIYIRTDKHLFCIADLGAAIAPATRPSLTDKSFDELKELYTSRKAAEGDDVAVRIDVVEAMAKVQDPRALEFLRDAALKDINWDPSEAAAKTLAEHGPAATDAMIAMSADWRPYLKVIAAEFFAKHKAEAGAATLIKGAANRDAMVRVACIRALAVVGRIEAASATADANGPCAQIVPVLTAALGDPEGVVKLAAHATLVARAGDITGADRDRVIAGLLGAAADRNPQVAAAALTAAKDAYKASADVLDRDVKLFGERRRLPVTETLRAGPVSMKFADGELRYLAVNDREIIRRVYFAVRDKDFDTAAPRFEKITVTKQGDATKGEGFKVDLAAVCRTSRANFRWTGQIVGDRTGRIVFSVSGQVGEDFSSPRVGINVLVGTDPMAGKAFETVVEGNSVVQGLFPELVSAKILSGPFKTLRYVVPGAGNVSITMDNGFPGMEDQRNYGDTSYKLFGALAYPYPKLVRGEKASQKLTIQPAFTKEPIAPATEPAKAPIEAKMPVVTISDKRVELAGLGSFPKLNAGLAAHKDDAAIRWAYTPVAHLEDDDMAMENLAAVTDQGRAVRAVAPTAKLRIEPAALASPHPGRAADPRGNGELGAAWAAAFVFSAGKGGIDEVALADTPANRRVQALLADWAGAKLSDSCGDFDAGRPLALAVKMTKDGKVALLAVNVTDQPRKVGSEHPPELKDRDLAPFEVRTVPLAKP